MIYFGGNAEAPTVGGKPTESGLVQGAPNLFDEVHAQHPDVTVIGRSLGSGIAVQVASAGPVARLVLVTPYDSIEEVAAAQFPWVSVHWLLIDKYDSWRQAPRIDDPTLVLAAEADSVIPRASTDRLVRYFQPGHVTFQILKGTDHSSISASPDYLPAMSGFIGAHSP